MMADIAEEVFKGNLAACPEKLGYAHAMCACGPVNKKPGENWFEFAFKFLKWDLKPETAERWRSFLDYLSKAGDQYTVGYQAGYTAGATKARQDMALAIKSLEQSSNIISNVLFDLKRQ